MRRRETLSRRRRGSASAGSPATLGGEGLMLRGMEGGEGTPATLSVTLSSSCNSCRALCSSAASRSSVRRGVGSGCSTDPLPFC